MLIMRESVIFYKYKDLLPKYALRDKVVSESLLPFTDHLGSIYLITLKIFAQFPSNDLGPARVILPFYVTVRPLPLQVLLCLN